MRLLDRINSKSVKVLNPNYLILNISTLPQLLDEAEEEFGVALSSNTISQYLGMDVVMSYTLTQDFILATECE